MKFVVGLFGSVCQRFLVRATLLGVGAVLSCLAFIQSAPVTAATGINQQINFQGRLLNQQGATVPDGYYNIQFKIYQDGDGQSVGNTTGSPSGTLLWTENHLNNNSQGVTVRNGFMSVQLGSITAFGSSIDWNQDTLWLSMNIGNTNLTCTPFSSCSPDGEMVPMKRLSASPYALNAGNLGGLSSADFLQLAQGVQTDSSNVDSIAINKTGSGDFITLQSTGTDVFTLTGSGNVLFGNNAVHTISVTTAGAGVAGKDLTITAGSSGTGGGLDGGDLILQGGAGSSTSGDVIVKANTYESDTLFQIKDSANNPIINVDSLNKVVSAGYGLTLPVPVFDIPLTSSDTGGSIANGTTYYYGITAVDGATETEISPIASITISSVTNTNQVHLSWTKSTTATGYKIYRNTTNNFTSGSLLLTTIGSVNTTTYDDTGTSTSSGLPPATVYEATLLRVDAAATNPFGTGQVDLLGSMYYNTTSGEFQCYKDAGVGGSWADCGVTTLQGAYDNADDVTVPEVKIDSIRGTFSIQDADSTAGTNILDIRASNGTGLLGTVMFSVGNTGGVTMQNVSDQNSAMRVLNASGTYLGNYNTTSGYFITNTIKPADLALQNPGFEAGGNITSGEEGWNGGNQASIVNSSSDAHVGNYSLQVAANTSTLKTYAGTYYTVAPGDIIYFEGWVKNSGGANGTGGVLIEGYDKDKSLIGSASDAGSLPGTSYVLRSTSYTVPSNVAYVRVAALVNSGATTGTYYFDDFHLVSSQHGQQAFQNTENSTSAFRILSAGASQTLFNADTTNNIIKVGDSTGTDTATTLFQLDAATAAPTTSLGSKNGSLYYDSTGNGLKAVISGAVVDICTTAVTCAGYSGSAGTTVQLQATSPGTPQTGHFNITGTGILTQLQTQDQSAGSTNSSGLTIRTGNATGTTSNSGSLILDVGTATGTKGTITIGSAGVATTMPGTLDIQGANTLALGTASTNTGSIVFRTSAGANTITIQAPGSNPSSSWALVLPQNPGSAGECLKDSSGTGVLAFGGCDPGSAVDLQDAYDNSSSPATLTLADNKNLRFISQDSTTDSNIFFDLQCDTSCGGNGRFAVQDDGTDVLTVSSTGTITLAGVSTQIGSGTTDSTQTNLQLDSYNQAGDSGTCNSTTNQGAMYYNTVSATIRACQGGSWQDLSNPDYLGLLSFGVIPSSGSNPYDLPSNVTAGVSGPCKVSWNSSTSVSFQACTAYSGGKRVSVSATTLNTNSASGDNTNLTTTNRWGHICLKTSDGQPAFTNTAGQATALAAQPSFSVSAPILCLADVQGSSTSGGTIDNIYDVRTFSSTIKEAVTTSTAAELGMLLDASSGSLVPSATCTTGTCSGKLYGVVVTTDGSTSTTTPNTIIATVGPGFVKATAGTAGQFIKSGPTAGYGETVASIPNNAFYYSPGNTRTTWSTTCSAASNCLGSLYVNFIVR